MSTAIPDCSPNASASRSSAGARPKSSSALGRSSTASRLTFWSVSTICSRSSAAAARADSGEPASSTCFRPSRIEVRAWPVSSWSSRASRRRSSSCPSTTLRSASRATRSARSTATAARAPKVSVRRRSSSVKRGSGPSLLCAAITPIGRSATIIGTKSPERRPMRRASSWSTSTSSSVESTRSLRRRSSTRPLFEPLRASDRPDQLLRGRPGGCLDPQFVGAYGDRDHHELRIDQRGEPLADQLEQRLELRLAGHRVPDLRQRLELRQPARRGLIQARVLDRDRGLRGEQCDELLVLGGEVFAALLLGQVQVAVRDAAQEDRDAEEATASAGDGAGSRPRGDRSSGCAAGASARR